jgi:hypothetical protein
MTCKCGGKLELEPICNKCECVSNRWISIQDKNPPDYTDILVTDGVRCWVAHTCVNLDIFLASHPDYKRNPENEYGVPFITQSRPTHWIPLPSFPDE